MSRHRFVYTLPSQDDSSFLVDCDSVSVLPSLYSYQETFFPHVISPEPDTFIPHYAHPYALVQYAPNPYLADAFCPDSFNSLCDFYVCNDDYSNIYSSINPISCFDSIYGNNSCFDSIYGDNSCLDSIDGDEIINVDLPSCSNEPIIEKLDHCQLQKPKMFPRVTNYGAVTILLRHLIRVDISPRKAVYVTNPPSQCIAAVNGVGEKSCVIHPNGRVLHVGKDIHMTTLDRKARICRRGITFSSEKHCLSYLVDDSGTKTTSEKFRNLDHDFSLQVFYHTDMAEKILEECHKMVNETKYKSYKNGDEVWMIEDIRIKQDERGDVKITRNGDHYAIKTSPTSGEISVKTCSADINIGRYADNYFHVRMGNKQVTASLNRFVVKNGTQKSGFNSSGRVALF